MNGWVPFDAEGWEETVELLQASGRPWPEAAAVFDLRWHVDQRKPLPGRDELQKRWRWKEWGTRQLLASPERWWDPSKGAPPTSRGELEKRAPVRRRTKILQETSRRPPGDLQETSSQTTEQPGERERILQETSRRPPGDLQETSTRAGIVHPAPSPSPEREQRAQRAPSRSPGGAGPAGAPDDAPTVPDGSPSWARGWVGCEPMAVLQAVSAIAEAIQQKPPILGRLGSSATHVRRLWDSLGRPPLRELVGEAELVARWAREAPSAENDIRGIDAKGNRWADDRSRQVSTLLDPAKWADRLDRAEQWRSGADPPTNARGYHPGLDHQQPTEEDLAAIAAWDSPSPH